MDLFGLSSFRTIRTRHSTCHGKSYNGNDCKRVLIFQKFTKRFGSDIVTYGAEITTVKVVEIMSYQIYRFTEEKPSGEKNPHKQKGFGNGKYMPTASGQIILFVRI